MASACRCRNGGPSRSFAGELPAIDNQLTIREHLINPDALREQTPGAPGKVESSLERTGINGRLVEGDEVGEASFGEDPAASQSIKAGGNFCDEVHCLLDRKDTKPASRAKF